MERIFMFYFMLIQEEWTSCFYQGQGHMLNDSAFSLHAKMSQKQMAVYEQTVWKTITDNPNYSSNEKMLMFEIYLVTELFIIEVVPTSCVNFLHPETVNYFTWHLHPNFLHFVTMVTQIKILIRAENNIKLKFDHPTWGWWRGKLWPQQKPTSKFPICLNHMCWWLVLPENYQLLPCYCVKILESPKK